MMVAVTGTHSTGKTSFLNSVSSFLKRRGYKCEHVEGVARKARILGLPILSKHTFESTLWIIAETIRLEDLARERADIVLVDRPVHDALAYYRAATLSQGTSDDSKANDSILEQLVAFRSTRYEFLYHTELDKNVPLGPGRDTNFAFRESVAMKILDVVARLESVSTLVCSESNFAEKQANYICEALNAKP